MASTTTAIKRAMHAIPRVASLAVTLMGPEVGYSTWYNRDDVVMGGRSASRAIVGYKELLFYGNVSLENRGGFAHVKCDALPTEELETAEEVECDALRITMVGDGKYYYLYCGGQGPDTRVRQRASLPVGASGEEVTAVVPLQSMVPTFRGRRVDTEPIKNVGKLGSVALLIADKQEGPFEMRLLQMDAVKMVDERDQMTGSGSGGGGGAVEGTGGGGDKRSDVT